MLVTFDSLFDIYPDTLRKGAVVGYTKPDGTPLEFPCTFDTGDAVRDAKGRWTASALGLTPVVAKYSEALKRTETKEAWVGNGFGTNPNAKYTVENATLEHVRFVDGVTSIGDYAFQNSGIKDFAIPDSVNTIGKYFCYGCTGLTEMSIPNSVSAIPEYAFYGCTNISKLILSRNTNSIGDYTFYNCSVKCFHIIPP